PNAIAPTNLVAVAGNGLVNLTWNATGGRSETEELISLRSDQDRAILGYRIYRNGTALVTITATNYQDTSVVNETTYTYYVTTVYSNPAGESAASNSVQATPTAQTPVEAVIGSGASTTATTASSPINIYYRSRHGQMVYTAAELSSAGIAGPINITQLGFYVETAPIYAMPNYIIRMKHTSATDVSTTQTLTGMTTVYSNPSYLPAAGGFQMLQLSTPFIWNGVDNIVVDFAFGIVDPDYNSSGTIKFDTVANSYRHWQSDSADQTANFTAGTLTNTKPQIKFTFAPVAAEPSFTISPTSHDFGTVLVAATATQEFIISNSGGGTLIINSLSIQGSNTFSIQNPPTLPLNLGAGISTTINVAFAPTADGAFTANLVIVDNLASKASRTVPLTGTGFDSQITVFPWTEGFDTFPVIGWDLTGGTRNWAHYPGTNPSVMANLWGWQAPNNALLTTPPLRPTLPSKLSFKWSHFYNSTYPNDAMRVSYSTDTINWTELWYRTGTEFNSNDGAGNTTPGTFATAEVDLPAGHTNQAFFIRFDAISGYGPNLYLDDVSITPLPTAPMIVVNPAALDFEEVAVGTSGQRQFSIQNAGSQTLTGNITTPANYHVAQASRDGNRNTLSFNIAAGETRNYTVTFSPTAAQAYNGNIVISSNAANNPNSNLPITGAGFVPPTIALSTDMLVANLAAGDEDNLSFVISNTGSRPLNFTIGMEEFFDRATARLSSSGRTSKSDRSIAGSTLTLDTDIYTAGTTVDWTFTVYNGSTDTEWLKDVYINFPDGVTVNSATDFIGGAEPMAPDNTSGNGIIINWHGEGSSGWGVIYGDQSATATVNVSIAANFTGNLVLDYQIDGDLYGAEPHTLSDSIVLSADVPPVHWLSCLPMSGTVPAGQTLPVDVYFSAVGMEAGSYIAVLTVYSNDPINPEKTVDAYMEVGVSNHAPTINLPANFSFDKNGSLTVDFNAYVADADGDPLTLQVSGNQSVLVGINGLSVNFTAMQNWIGTEAITFTVSDGISQASDVVQVTVNPVNLPVWQPVVYPNNPATIYGKVTVEGIPAQANDLVAAFVGEECRGIAEVIIVDRSVAYATLLVYLNEPGEIVQLKVYSYTEDIIYDVNQTYQPQYGEIIGSDTPEPIDGTTLIAIQTPVPVILLTANSVQIQWNAVAHADRYKIYASDTPEGEYILIGTTISTQWQYENPGFAKFFYIVAEKTMPVAR
ncbi:MAG: choice-of-anchor D domain-containing protein, partial [Candidatus Cloacimonadaceae bacterium]|nr:choice-of-anchor D domain-containing protein [Candidatus Cloacimonadaceae bacterium]